MNHLRGRRLGFDVGTVRVGIAYSDPDGILASPYGVVNRRNGDNFALRDIAQIVTEIEPVELVIGQPTSLDGAQRASAGKARRFADKIVERTGLPVRYVDERFTTTQAHVLLQAAGKTSKQRREYVDAQAAVVILQTALDAIKHEASLMCETEDSSEY